MLQSREILEQVDKLIVMYKNGDLGGEVMPEDANPHLGKSSRENYLYFTLPMALNYQRNSYTLWESALKTYEDETTRFVFEPKEVLQESCLRHWIMMLMRSGILYRKSIKRSSRICPVRKSVITGYM